MIHVNHFRHASWFVISSLGQTGSLVLAKQSRRQDSYTGFALRHSLTYVQVMFVHPVILCPSSLFLLWRRCQAVLPLSTLSSKANFFNATPAKNDAHDADHMTRLNNDDKFKRDMYGEVA